MQKLLFALVAIFGFISAVEIEDGVLVLNDDNFDEELAKHPLMVIEFYAPWCGHCKKLAPEYAAAAQALAEQERETPIVLAKVDCDKATALKTRFGISTFPTLYWFTDGKQNAYTGGRTTDKILHWLDQKTGPAFQEIESCEELKATAEKKKFSLIYFGDLEGADFDTFKAQWEVPEYGDNPKFAFIHGHDDCAAGYGASVPGFALVRNFDEPVTRASGEPAEIKDWIKSHQFPFVMSFDEDAIKPVFAERKQSFVLFTNEGDDNDYSKVFASVAKELHGELLFIRCGTKTKVERQLSGFAKIQQSDLPALRIISPGKSALIKYGFEGSVRDVNAEDLKQFVADFKADKLSPFLTSEDVPTSQEGPITKVVAKNFNEIVMDTTKDVVIYFHSNNCRKCEHVDPIWDDLSAEYSQVHDLVIAKMDFNANDVENLNVKGLPAIRYYPKDDKEGTSLDDKRHLKQFSKFFEEYSSAVKEFRAANNQEETQEKEVIHEDL